MLAGVIRADRRRPSRMRWRRWPGCAGELPLALRIAGQLLAAHPVWPVERLARMWPASRTGWPNSAPGDLQVRAAFEGSYAQLAAKDARLFRLLGLHPGPDWDTCLAAAALAGAEPEAAEPALDRLAEAHMVTEEALGRFVMRDLLRLFARAICHQADSPADRDTAEARPVSHYLELAGLWMPAWTRSCARKLRRPGLPPLPSVRKALALFQTERPSLVAVVGLAAQHGWDEQVLRLSESMGDSLRVLYYVDAQLTIRKAAVAAARHAGDTSAESNALTGLGNASEQIRRLNEAITCHQQALAITREVGDRHGEGQTLNTSGASTTGCGGSRRPSTASSKTSRSAKRSATGMARAWP